MKQESNKSVLRREWEVRKWRGIINPLEKTGRRKIGQSLEENIRSRNL